MTGHAHGRGGDCPACKKVQALEKKLGDVLEATDLGSRDKAYSLILVALVELFVDYGPEGAKREFMTLARRRFEQLDQNASHLAGLDLRH
jgi:hypothetical protein